MKHDNDNFYTITHNLFKEKNLRIAALEEALQSVADGKPKGWTTNNWMNAMERQARALLTSEDQNHV